MFGEFSASEKKNTLSDIYVRCGRQSFHKNAHMISMRGTTSKRVPLNVRFLLSIERSLTLRKGPRAAKWFHYTVNESNHSPKGPKRADKGPKHATEGHLKNGLVKLKD